MPVLMYGDYLLFLFMDWLAGRTKHLGPLHTRDRGACDHLLHFKHSHWWNGRSRSKFASHYAWGIDRVCEWMQDGCEVYMDSYMVLNGSCFMVIWIVIKIHLLEVNPTQNQETMALRMFATVGLIYFIMCEGRAWMKIYWNSIWLRARIHVISHYTWGSVTIVDDFGDDSGRPLDTFFGDSQFHGHGIGFVCRVALTYRWAWLSLRNDQSKFKASGNLPFILEESMEYTSIFFLRWRKNLKDLDM